MSGLTTEEKGVLSLLCNAWNEFIKLPKHDDADLDEFMQAIHAAQALIALRVARRVDPDIWRQP